MWQLHTVMFTAFLFSLHQNNSFPYFYILLFSSHCDSQIFNFQLLETNGSLIFYKFLNCFFFSSGHWEGPVQQCPLTHAGRFIRNNIAFYNITISLHLWQFHNLTLFGGPGWFYCKKSSAAHVLHACYLLLGMRHIAYWYPERTFLLLTCRSTRMIFTSGHVPVHAVYQGTM